MAPAIFVGRPRRPTFLPASPRSRHAWRSPWASPTRHNARAARACWILRRRRAPDSVGAHPVLPRNGPSPAHHRPQALMTAPPLSATIGSDEPLSRRARAKAVGTSGSGTFFFVVGVVLGSGLTSGRRNLVVAPHSPPRLAWQARRPAAVVNPRAAIVSVPGTLLIGTPIGGGVAVRSNRVASGPLGLLAAKGYPLTTLTFPPLREILRRVLAAFGQRGAARTHGLNSCSSPRPSWTPSPASVPSSAGSVRPSAWDGVQLYMAVSR